MEYMGWEDIERASLAWRVADGGVGSPYDEFRGKFLPLPKWFQENLDPLSDGYLSQQDRLWQMMVGDGADYQPERDELTVVSDSWAQSIVRPGLYGAPTSIAGDHLIAMGHILKHSKVADQDRVLEYGAGFGQIALTFARRGAHVHTVDIDESFCSAVRAQGEFFKVSLQAHKGQFGDNPAGGKYKLICFYESFHHARSFAKLITVLRDMLEDDGQIIMAGEPIQPSSNSSFAKSCPYPWGIRLEAEVASIVRFKRWYELGFKEEFLLKLFVQKGFCFSKYACDISHYANVYAFSPRPKLMKMSELQLPPTDEETWHGRESNGRWTKHLSTITLDGTASWSAVRLDLINHHARPTETKATLGKRTITCNLGAGKRKVFDLPRELLADTLVLSTNAVAPSSYGMSDTRNLGVFVHSIEYV